jgi:hypothetical protein
VSTVITVAAAVAAAVPVWSPSPVRAADDAAVTVRGIAEARLVPASAAGASATAAGPLAMLDLRRDLSAATLRRMALAEATAAARKALAEAALRKSAALPFREWIIADIRETVRRPDAPPPDGSLPAEPDWSAWAAPKPARPAGPPHDVSVTVSADLTFAAVGSLAPLGREDPGFDKYRAERDALAARSRAAATRVAAVLGVKRVAAAVRIASAGGLPLSDADLAAASEEATKLLAAELPAGSAGPALALPVAPASDEDIQKAAAAAGADAVFILRIDETRTGRTGKHKSRGKATLAMWRLAPGRPAEEAYPAKAVAGAKGPFTANDEAPTTRQSAADFAALVIAHLAADSRPAEALSGLLLRKLTEP